MNALVKKEIRLLLPNWALALVLAFCACGVADHQSSTSVFRVYVLTIFPFVLTPALVVMLALDSFGRELSAGTFSGLLAQPVSRERLWRTKTALLAVVIFSVWAVWWLAVNVNSDLIMTPAQRSEILTASLLVGLVAYSGGLWTVLLLRQVGPAFWITLIVPGVLAVFTDYVSEKLGMSGQEGRNIAVVLTLYAIAGFCFARHLFHRAQDAAWTGGELKLPVWLRGLDRLTGLISGKSRRPWRVLIAKELHLHQGSLIIAIGLAVLNAAVPLVRHLPGEMRQAWAMDFVVEAFWALWLLMPILIGCTAVAEERRLGTLEAQLCLPVRRRTQFITKFGIALVLALVLGMALPLVFEGGRIVPELAESQRTSEIEQFYRQFSGGGLILRVLAWHEIVKPVLPFALFALFPLSFVAVAFYASTLARNTLQAFAPSILGLMLIGFLLQLAAHLEEWTGWLLWRGWLIYLLGLPALAVAVAGLAFWNFKRILVGWPVWRRNGLVLLTTLAAVTLLTSAIYHRVWEFLSPLEPRHGPAQLVREPGLKFSGGDFEMTIRLADGRVWLNRYLPFVSGSGTVLTGDWTLLEQAPGRKFLEGNDWAEVTAAWVESAAVKTDGTLWVRQHSENRKTFWQISTNLAEPVRMVQLGTSNDWKKVAHQFALKQDGTLWRLGGSLANWTKNWAGFIGYEPQRLGKDSDWADLSLATSSGEIIFTKTNGETWRYGGIASLGGSASMQLDESLVLYRGLVQPGTNWVEQANISGRHFGTVQIGLHRDGSLRVNAVYSTVEARYRSQDIRLGKDSDWVAIAGRQNMLVAVKADGSLWRWNFPKDPAIDPGSVEVTRLSTHSDWLAVRCYYDGVVSLAADGSLWFWRFDNSARLWDIPLAKPLIGPSHRPQNLGNIFAKAK